MNQRYLLLLHCGLHHLLPSVVWAQQAVGMSPGNFSAAQSGSANYSVPLRIAPGTNGFEPKLALAYNSQGLMGLLGLRK